VGWLQLVEDLPVGTHCVRLLGELLVVDFTQSQAEFDTLGDLCRRRDPLLEYTGQFSPLLVASVDPIQIRKRVSVAFYHCKHIAIGLLGSADVAQFLLVDSSKTLADGRLDLLSGALRAQHVRVGVSEFFPPVVDHSSQTLDLFTGALLQRELANAPHAHPERHHRIHQPLLGILRDAAIHGQALLRVLGEPELRLVHLKQLLPLPASLVERLEDRAHLRLSSSRDK